MKNSSSVGATEILGAIDVERERFVDDRNDFFTAPRQQFAGAAIIGIHDEFVEPRARQQCRHADAARIRGRRSMLLIHAPRRDECIQVRRIERRLITQYDQRTEAFGWQRKQAGAQRCAHTERPVGTIDPSHCEICDAGIHGIGIGAEYDDGGQWPRRQTESRRALHERFAAQPQQLLGRAQSARGTCGEHDESMR